MPDNPRDDLRAYLDFGLELAAIAERAILPYYQRCTISRKADGSEVTEADRSAEEQMRARIERDFPGHGIIGEEFGTKAPAPGEPTWVLDPLDGTAGFTLGVAGFGTLIALMVDDDPAVGVCHFPALGDTVYAARGGGCWWRPRGGEPIRSRVSEPVDLEQAIASATAAHSTDIQHAPGQTPYRLSRLINACGKFRFVPDCLQHALICRGRLHVAVDTVMAPWDIAALVPCIEEAGGVATTLEGRREGIVHGGSLLTSCDERLHRAVVEMLRPA